MEVKTIGILGLGKQTTHFYLKEINDFYNNEHSNIKLLNTDFDKINSLLPTPSKQLEHIVKGYIDELTTLDIDAILIPNITLHETIDKLKNEAKIIHPIHTVISELQKYNHKNIILFGSIYTMKSNYIKSIFKDDNIETLLPTNEEMKFIDDVRKQVYQNTATKELLDDFNLIIKKYAQNNAIVIACTELSIALKNENLKVFDMARIQIKNIV